MMTKAIIMLQWHFLAFLVSTFLIGGVIGYLVGYADLQKKKYKEWLDED